MATDPKILEQEAVDFLAALGKQTLIGNGEANAEGLAILGAYLMALVGIEREFSHVTWTNVFSLVFKVMDGEMLAPIVAIRPRLQAYVNKYKHP